MSFIFLFLITQTMGVTAMAMSIARLGPVKVYTLRVLVIRLISSTSMLNRQSVMKPVVRETNSAC